MLGRELTLSIKDFEDIVDRQMFISPLGGEKLTFDKRGIKGNASPDRIDSSKGYIPGNVQWITKEEQKMKMDLSMNKVRENVKRIYENLQLQHMEIPKHQAEIKCAA